MLVKGHEFAECFGGEALGENGVRRPIAFEYSMWHKPIRRALSLHLLGSFAKGQCLGLGENIRQQHVVMVSQQVERLYECDEVAGNEPGTLMDQLVKGVLAVCSRFAPVNRTSRVSHRGPIERDMLAVALHRQLLEVGGEPFQVLFVRQNRYCLRSKKVVVPDAQQRHQDRQVALEWSGAEVLVHLVESSQHGAEVLRPDGNHGRKPNRRIHRIAPANPIPEAEHVGGINAELGHLRRVRRNSDEMFRHGFLVALETLQYPAAGRMCVRHRLQGGECL